MPTVWLITIVVGPLLLLGLLIWVARKNRTRSAAEEARSEAAAHRLRDEIEREREITENDRPEDR